MSRRQVPPSQPQVGAATREAFLQAGYERLGEKGLGGLRLTDLIKATGSSNGSFYNCWPGGMEEFSRDLVTFAVETTSVSYLQDLLSGLQSVEPSKVAFRDVVQLYAASDSELIDRDPAFIAQMTLWPTHESNPKVKELLRESYQAHMERLYVPAYETLLTKYGLRVREPLTVRKLAVLITSLAEGLGLRRAVDPDAVGTSDLAGAEGWDLFGLGLMGLLGSTLCPIDGRNGSLVDFAEELMTGAAGMMKLDERRSARRDQMERASLKASIANAQAALETAIKTLD